MVAGTTKDSKMLIRGLHAKQTEVWRGGLQSLGRENIQEMRCDMKSFDPVGGRHASLEQQ